MGTSKLPDSQLHFVQSIAARVLVHYRDLPTVLGLEPFIPLTDLLHGPAQRDFFRRLLELVTAPAAAPLRDPVALHFAFQGAKLLHDALDAISADGDRREAAALATRLVGRCNFNWLKAPCLSA